MNKTLKVFLLLCIVGIAGGAIYGIYWALSHNWLMYAGVVSTIFYILLLTGLFIGLVFLFRYVLKQ
jgi:hypothetical protein